MRRHAHAVLLVTFVLGVNQASAQAQAAPDPGGRLHPAYALQRTEVGWLALELAGSGAIALAIRYGTGERARECGWCDTNAFDRAVRRSLLARDPELAGTFSRVAALGLTPAIALAGTWLPGLAAGDVSYALEDSVIIVSSFVLAAGINHGIKKLSERQRPAFHYGVEQETEFSDHPEEEFMSFGSGDTTWAFAFAAAGSTVAYLRGYASAPAVVVFGGMSASAAALLRIAADAHWATDVLMGAAVGTTVGVLVPLLLHPRASERRAFGTGAPAPAFHLVLGGREIGITAYHRF